MNQHVAEDIVLLRMLTAEPGRPTSSPVQTRESDLSASEQDWPLRHENKIVECLAFLSASTDDSNKVSAVCIERCLPKLNACVIRVAMNTGVTKEYVTGVKKLARALEECHRQPEEIEDDQLLRTALGVSRKRILTRLRSKHACSVKSARRPPLVDRLQKMTEALSRVNSNDPLLPSLTPIVEELGNKFAQLEAIPSLAVHAGNADELLLSLLYTLDDLPPLTAAAESLTGNRICDFQDPDSVLMAITKLRNYRAACQSLKAAAQEYAIFEKVTVADVGGSMVKPGALKKAQAGGKALDAVVRRLGLRWTEQTPMRLGIKLADASAQFEIEMRRWKPKVHAEIQLLCFYESNPNLTPPRVICSSKAACFLCELFIRLHGKYVVSKTHGVLWPQWALPDCQSINLTGARAVAMRLGIAAFKAELERKIRMQWTQKKAKPMHPGESFTSLVKRTPSRVSLAQDPFPNTDPQAAADTATIRDGEHATTTGRSLEVSAEGVSLCQHESILQISTQNGAGSDSAGVGSDKNPLTGAQINDDSAQKSDSYDKRSAMSHQDLPIATEQFLREPEPALKLVVSGSERLSKIRSSNDLDGRLPREALPSIRDHGSRLRDTSDGKDVSGVVLTNSDTSFPALAVRKFNFHDEKFSIYMELPIKSNVTVTRYQESCFHERDVVIDISTLQPGDSIDLDARVHDGESTIVVVKESRKYGRVWFEIKWK